MNYLEKTREIYKQAAVDPSPGLCCTTSPVWSLPGLKIPLRMLEMNYGCGSTVHFRDLSSDQRVLYVGVGGGLELLQFSYFNRHTGTVIGVDSVPEMIAACRDNLSLAENENEWFRSEFIDIREGDALSLPVEDDSVDIAAQNCLFNIFKQEELGLALSEMYRVLKPHGKLILSDPVCEAEIPSLLREDDQLRAMCISGAIPLMSYVDMLTGCGFGTIEIRAKRPYRLLDPAHFDVKERIMIESVEVCAIKNEIPYDGPCVFTGRCAIYVGNDELLDDNKGHVLPFNMPVSVCDKTANALQNLNRKDIVITQPTWFYAGGGCC